LLSHFLASLAVGAQVCPALLLVPLNTSMHMPAKDLDKT
jgi:hypothetical protein